jgi:hypothetical protein
MNVLMKPLILLLVVLLVVIVGGLIFLSTWDIPAPSARIEKVIPNDRLAR